MMDTTILGALADSVQEVIDLEPSQIEPAPRIGTRAKNRDSASSPDIACKTNGHSLEIKESAINNLDTLFAFAIKAEISAKHFYRKLSIIFSHVPEVSLAWRTMMKDEDSHAVELMKIRMG